MDGTVRLFKQKASVYEPLKPIRNLRAPVTSLALRQPGEEDLAELAVGTGDGAIYLFDAMNGSPISLPHTFVDLHAAQAPARVALDADGTIVGAVESNEGVTKIVTAGGETELAKDDGGPVTAIVAARPRRFVVATLDGRLRMLIAPPWERPRLKTEPVGQLPGHARMLRVDRRQGTLLAIGSDGTLLHGSITNIARLTADTTRRSRLRLGPSAVAGTLPDRAGRAIPTRVFLGPHDVPPMNFAAYGIVAFQKKATSETVRRQISICEAFVATLPDLSEVIVPSEEQMVTVWPLDDAKLATAKPDCKLAVEHYHLPTALTALKEARTQGNVNFSGAGPYLLSWAPSSNKGKKDALVLVADLSNSTRAEDFFDQFRAWRDEIEKPPELWRRGWSAPSVTALIRHWADRWGTMFLPRSRQNGD
jgi:hypothetical protein